MLIYIAKILYYAGKYYIAVLLFSEWRSPKESKVRSIRIAVSLNCGGKKSPDQNSKFRKNVAFMNED